MNSMSLATSREPARTAARIVVEHPHAAAGAQQGLHQAGADEAAAAGDEDAGVAHAALSWPASSLGKVDPGALAVRAPGGVHQPLHAIAFGKSGRGRAAAFDGVEKAFGQPRHRCDAAVGILRVDRIADGDAFERRRRPLGVKQFEAAHVIGARIMQHQRAVLAEEFDAVAGAEKGRAAHAQAAQAGRPETRSPSPPSSPDRRRPAGPRRAPTIRRSARRTIRDNGNNG